MKAGERSHPGEQKWKKGQKEYRFKYEDEGTG